MDAYVDSGDYSVVTRTAQGDDSQKWVITSLGSGEYTVQQKMNMRYMDAYVDSGDYSVVTRPTQGDDSQKWVITQEALPAGTYIFQQKINMRYMDAHESSDYSVVTRTAQGDDSQKWVITQEAFAKSKSKAQPEPQAGTTVASEACPDITGTWVEARGMRQTVTQHGCAYTG